MQFFLRTCDPGGQILHDRGVEARDVQEAMALANVRCRAMLRRDRGTDAVTFERIDVADARGRTVARLTRSEALQSMF